MAKNVHEVIAKKKAQIATLTAEVTALQAKADTEIDPALIVAGVKVDFNYGKAPSLRPLTGTVTGVKVSEPGQKGGTLVRIAVGEGFDAQVVTIFPSAVTKVYGPEVPADEAAAAE